MPVYVLELIITLIVCPEIALSSKSVSNILNVCGEPENEDPLFQVSFDSLLSFTVIGVIADFAFTFDS